MLSAESNGSASQEVADATLHLLKANIATGLTLEMSKQSSESGELLSTANLWAVVEFRSMAWRLQMLVKATQFGKGLVAEIAFVRGAVKTACCCRVAGIAVPLEESVGDGVVLVVLTNDFEDGIAIEVARFGAGAGLKVVRNATCADEGCLAERAFDLFTAMQARVAVLL